MTTEWKPDTEGVFYGLTAEQYHAAPGFSHSMAKHMEPPARLPAYLEHKEEPTVAMIMGTLVHQRVLEPDKPLPRLAVKPEGMKFSTTEGKAWKKEQDGAGLIILTQNEFDAVVGCVDSIRADERCKQMFMHGQSEVSLFKKHLGTGVLCKARLDWVPIGDFLVDIKKVLEGQSDPDEFPRVRGWLTGRSKIKAKGWTEASSRATIQYNDRVLNWSPNTQKSDDPRTMNALGMIRNSNVDRPWVCRQQQALALASETLRTSASILPDDAIQKRLVSALEMSLGLSYVVIDCGFLIVLSSIIGAFPLNMRIFW